MLENDTLEVVPIPALRDNYIWLLQRHGHAVLVDPGDALPALEYLHLHHLTLDAILITHHHSDHIDGVEELLQAFPVIVYAPQKEYYSFPHQSVAAGDEISLAMLGIRLKVMETPGHTLDHVAYYGANCLFCGDTMFGCGCGRLFEGSAAQLFSSLQKLAQLPGETQVFCAHEYTLQNIHFARMVDPENADLAQREKVAQAQRSQASPTLPSTIALEIATNPFLRCYNEAIGKATMRHQGQQGTADPEDVFRSLREMKNHY
jgi:hydroxyacylglutathione hydrolase